MVRCRLCASACVAGLAVVMSIGLISLAGCADLVPASGQGGTSEGTADANGDAMTDGMGQDGGPDDSQDGGGSTEDSDEPVNGSQDGPSDANNNGASSDDDLLVDTPNADYLGTLPLASVTVAGQEFLVWVADDSASRQRGLMFVTAEEMADLPDGRRRGMLFVFEDESLGGFWMLDTITPLDIAFIDVESNIVTIHTMAPLDTSIYRPSGPYLYALEVNAETFDELGVTEGSAVVLP